MRSAQWAVLQLSLSHRHGTCSVTVHVCGARAARVRRVKQIGAHNYTESEMYLHYRALQSSCPNSVDPGATMLPTGT